MKRLLLIFLFSISFAQTKDTTLVLEKNDYIGIIRGIKYLEAKDSLTDNLINQYETQVGNYKNLHEKDSLQQDLASQRMKDVVDNRNKIASDLNDCENPPFYATRSASFVYGVLTVIIIALAL